MGTNKVVLREFLNMVPLGCQQYQGDEKVLVGIVLLVI